MHPRRFTRALALLAVILVTAWLFTPKPGRSPAPVVEKPAATPAASTPPPLAVSSAPSRPGGDPTSAAPTSSATPGAAVASRVGSPTPPVALAPPATTVVTPPVAGPDAASAIAVDQVRLMLRDYRTLMGENPIGTNAEIMRALMGDNPRQARLGPPEGQTLNDQGELVDRWGTPLFFHQLSKTSMEIRSAGPDKIMWTEDDIVSK